MDEIAHRVKVRSWGFLTNHAHVLLCIHNDPNKRLRDIANTVGITERAAQLILADLIEDGYVIRTKIGRRNNYKVESSAPMRHPVLAEVSVGRLLDAMEKQPQL